MPVGCVSWSMELIGIDSWGGRAVFGLHVAAALAMIGLGAGSINAGNLGPGVFSVVIGLMLVVVGRSAGRITARR